MNPSGLAQVDAHLMFGLAHAFFQPQFAQVPWLQIIYILYAYYYITWLIAQFILFHWEPLLLVIERGRSGLPK